MNNDTLLRDVFSLEPGSYIEININDLKYFKYKYWDTDSIQENKIYNYVCYKEKIKNLLINSVKIKN